MAKQEGSFLNHLNPLAPCRKYHLPLRQCPQFLFFLMGFIILIVISATYLIATFRIGDPKVVSLLVLAVGGFLFIIDYIIINSFERVAEASRMKTEFIGIVSHQLRSPLTNLKFSLELLMSGKMGKIEGDEIEYFKILRENTQRMGDLINDLIVVSRIESGEFPLKRTRVSLLEITEKLVEKNKPFAEASNVKIALEAQNNPPDAWADPLWLEQVVKNLLDNAIRYTKGRGAVVIRIFADKKKLNFEIEDSGVGIPESEQRFVFRKFFRSKNAVRHQTEGSGLGLHIAKQVIELFGGKVWFKSKEHQGTTFYFYLPIKRGVIFAKRKGV